MRTPRFRQPAIVLLVCLGLTASTVGRGADKEPDQAVAARYKAERGLVMAKPLRIGGIKVNADRVTRGEKFEITFTLDATYDNPFDPREVAVDCTFVGPAGRRIAVPAFFCSPFTVGEDGSETEILKPEWKVRFTPRRLGTYAYQVTARGRSSGTVQSPRGAMRCSEGTYNGFCRVAANKSAFEHDNGTPYHAIGLNLLGGGWVKVDRPLPRTLAQGKIRLLDKLSEFGGTFARFRIEGGYHPIERPMDLKAGFLGPGWYQQRVCHGADRIFDAARRLDIQMMLCLYEGIVIGGGGGKWYGRTNWSLEKYGGPCKSTGEFWTNEEALRLVRQKLRYVVARWGYSPNLLAWEFFNEIGGPQDKIVAWHRDMARYLRSIDPYDHLITTSSHTKDNSLWKLAEIEYAQQHVYSSRDIAATMKGYAEWASDILGKPVLFGEFGPPWREKGDPEGVSMHNAIWGTALSGGCGVADWYIGYLRKCGLFRHYRTFAAWSAGVPWNHPRMQPLTVQDVVTARSEKGGTPVYQDMAISGMSKKGDYFAKAGATRFPVDPKTRRVGNIHHLQPYLHAMESRKTKPVFVLDCGVPAEFHVLVSSTVGDSSNGVKIYLDGKPAATTPFPAAKGEGKTAKGPDKWGNWTVAYAEPRIASIDVPKGRHEVMVEAVGKDRLIVSYHVLRYATGPSPSRVLGRRTDEAAWLWVQSTSSRANELQAGIRDEARRTVSGVLTGLADGNYRIDWYDCWKGRQLGVERAECTRGRLAIQTPPFVRDIAAKVKGLRR